MKKQYRITKQNYINFKKNNMKKTIFTLGAALLLFSACSSSTESNSTSDSTLVDTTAVATDSTQVSDSLQVKAGEIKSTEEVN
jgi:uncharacterized protein YcfL